MGNSDVTFEQIAARMESDPMISFKLLRFISTSTNVKRSQITTVKHALSYLGLYEVRKFIALIAVANLNENTCEEILNIALIRGKFCEYVCMQLSRDNDLSSAYLIGLLSMISPILKTEPKILIPKIPISQDMKTALLHKEGELGTLLSICESYEYADWVEIEKLGKAIGLNLGQIDEAYHQSLEWHIENPISAIKS